MRWKWKLDRSGSDFVGVGVDGPNGPPYNIELETSTLQLRT